MSLENIVIWPDKRLSEICLPFTAWDDESSTSQLGSLITWMTNTMWEAGGIGIAAPQVGSSLRVICWKVDETKDAYNDGCLVNPVIEFQQDVAMVAEEGCLSFPGLSVPVSRPGGIIVTGKSPHGEDRRIEAKGLLARVIQHEIDHLNGITLADKMGKLKRELWKKRLTKWKDKYDHDNYPDE